MGSEKQSETGQEAKTQKGSEEKKSNTYFTQNQHHRKRSPEYLLQPQTDSTKLHAFWIPKKELKTYELGFTISKGMGFYHVENDFYFGGGTVDFKKYVSNFSKINARKITELQMMSTPKCFFAMALWKQRSSLFTLGGKINTSHLN